MRNTKSQTWLSYIKSTAGQINAGRSRDNKGEEPMLSIQHSFHSFFQHSIPMMYVVDYKTSRYNQISEGTHAVIGYSPKDFLQGGLGFTIDNYHPQDLRLFNEQIFPDRLKFLKSKPPEDHIKYVFSYTFRLKNKNGTYNTLLQRNCFVESDAHKNPLLSMGMVLNIDHYSQTNPVMQTIEKISTADSLPEMVDKKFFYLNEEDRLFTRREKEILMLSIEGLSYKQIARKLYIADGTVLQHRKNMLQKTNTKNVAELVSFAILNHHV